jgi:hypothetical protein
MIGCPSSHPLAGSLKLRPARLAPDGSGAELMEDAMDRLSALAIFAAVSMPLPAWAQPDRAPAPPAAQPAAAPEKKVCRTMTDLGSIIPRHICARRKQWDEVVRANEADADALRFSQHPNAPTLLQQIPSSQ